MRSGLDACLKALRKGDVLVVWKLDRLRRGFKHHIKTHSFYRLSRVLLRHLNTTAFDRQSIVDELFGV